jgi:hypothetical protein
MTRYNMYLIELDKKPQDKSFYAEHFAETDVEAVKFFRKTTRDVLLRQYVEVKAIVQAGQRHVIDFTENRVTDLQKTRDFLHRS